MKIIAILIALLIIGLLISKQLAPKPSLQVNELPHISEPGLPTLPATPGETEQFGKQMNDYVKAEAEKRAAQLDEAGAK